MATETTDIKTTVNGSIQSGGLPLDTKGFSQQQIETDQKTITLPQHGFSDGEEVLFLPRSTDGILSPSLGDLIPAEFAFVRVLNENQFQLYFNDTIDLGFPSGDERSTQTVSLYDTLFFDPQNSVDPEQSRILLTNHPFETGQHVRYGIRPPTNENPSDPIGGLYDAADYYVITDAVNPSSIRLAVSEDDALAGLAIELTDLGVGSEHYFTYLSESRSFSPYADLNEVSNSIEVDTTGINTGDPLLYRVDPELSSLVAMDRQYGFSVDESELLFDANGTINFNQTVIDPNSFTIALPDHGWNSGDRVTYYPSDVNEVSSSPIFLGSDSFLEDGGAYTVIKVNDDLIQLADSLAPLEALEISDTGESGMQRLVRIEDSSDFREFNPSGTVEWLVVNPRRNSILFEDPHQLVDGQRVTYFSGLDAEGNSNVPVNGLESGRDYFVVVVSDYEVQLTRNRQQDLPRDIFTGLSSNEADVIDLSAGASGGASSRHSFVAHNVDVQEDWVISPGHELEPGQQVQYQAVEGGEVGGLIDGATYFAYPLDANTLRLTESLQAVADLSNGMNSWVDLQEGGTGRLQQFKTRSLSLPFQAGRTESVVDVEANTVELNSHGLASGQLVNYQTSDGDPIGGLENDGTYEVIVVDADHIQLAAVIEEGETAQNALEGVPIDLSGGASLGLAMHLFRVIPKVSLSDQSDPVLVFDPTLGVSVDVVGDRIRVLGSRLQAGDSFTYLSGGGEPVGGLIDGQVYHAIPEYDQSGNQTTWMQIALTEADALQGTAIDLTDGAAGYSHSILVDSVARQSDLPLLGLSSETTYYAVVDGPNQLRLAETPQEALGAVSQDLTPSSVDPTAEYSLSDADDFTGIKIEANLKEVKNKQAAGTQVGSQPTFSDLITKPEVLARRNISGFRHGHPSTPTLSAKRDRNQFLAGVAINLAEHDVHAVVGQSEASIGTSTSTLRSGSDITINAAIKQKVQTKAQGDSVVDRGKKFVFAAGFAFTDISNTAEAVVGSNAVLNAIGSTDVTAAVKYPLLVEKQSLIPFNVCGVFTGGTEGECHPIADLATYMDGKLGLTRVLNTWANSKAFAAKRSKDYADGNVNTVKKSALPEYTATISAGYANYRNHAEAIIKSGASINELLTDSEIVNASVNVNAKTDVTLVALAGIMHLKLNEAGLQKMFWYRNNDMDTIGNAFSLTANKSSSFGLGTSFMEQFLSNHVYSVIQEGAVVKSGQSSEEDAYGNSITTGIRVESKAPSKTFNFTQSGANSEGAAVTVSQGLTKEVSETLAMVGNGVSIDSAGPLEVLAKNDALHSSGAGGFAFGDTLGLGLSASTIVVDRHTGAIVGDLPEHWHDSNAYAELPTDGPVAEPSIHVKKLVMESANIGQQTAVSVVGAKAAKNNRASGALSRGAATRSDSKFKSHVGLAGDTAVNVANDVTDAHMDFTGDVYVKDVAKVKAKNETDYLAVTGAASIAWNGSGSETASVGMTAAVSVNDLELTTASSLGGEVFVPDSEAKGEDWHMGSLAIETASHGDVLAVAVALGISQLNKAEFALNAAFSWASNPLIDRSHSYLEPLLFGSYHIEGEHAIDLELSSTNDRSINASSGAAALTFGSAAVGLGIGVSPAVNDITIETLANIQPGVSLWTDVVEILALQQADIETWSMAGAGEFPSGDFSVASLGYGPKGFDLELVGSVAINRVTSKSRATIGGDPEQRNTDRVTLHDVGEIRAESKNHSDVKAIAGEGFIAIQSSMAAFQISLGLAFGLNEIREDSFSEAMLVGVDVLEASGDIELVSEFAPRLKAVSVAVSLGVIFGSSGLTFASVDGVGAFAVNSVGTIDNKRDHKGKRTAVGIRNESGIRHSFIEVVRGCIGDSL